MASESQPAEEKKTHAVIAALCARLPSLSTGDRAALRRLFLTQSQEADGIIVRLLVEIGLSEVFWRSKNDFDRWTLIAHVAATLSGTKGENPFNPARSIGDALAEANYSELRLMRLTSARGSLLRAQIIRATRFLAASGAGPLNLVTFFDLSEDTSGKAEAARLRFARNYFSSKARASKKKDAS